LIRRIKWGILISCFIFTDVASAGTPVTIHQSYAGKINFLTIAGSFRTSPDMVIAAGVPLPVPNSGCLVSAPGVPSSADLSLAVVDPAVPAVTGLPAGAAVLAAHLYWAGSYTPLAQSPTSTQTVPDADVTFDGIPITADRMFTENYLAYYDFFSGYKDVTSIVAAKGNGVYTLNDLSVNTDTIHCASSAVLSAWSLVVIYNDPAPTAPTRVINLFDGFTAYRGSRIFLNPYNFVVPTAPINGKLAYITWEGDALNSGILSFVGENFAVKRPLGVWNNLTSIDNPLLNQFNSTSTDVSPTSITAYGVDSDVYDISPYLVAGDTTVQTLYGSGADLVLLTAEVFSTTNTPVADLSISKTHVADFNLGQPNDYNINVTNNGPDISAVTETITVTDTIPAGLTFNAATGTGWTCSFVTPTLTCTTLTALAVGASLPTLAVNVTPTIAAVPSITNTATVASTMFDHIATNNTSSDLTVVRQPEVTVLKSAAGPSGPADVMTYTVQVFNTGPTLITNVINTDVLSNYTQFGVDCDGTGISVVFNDGTPVSGLSMGTPIYSSTVPPVLTPFVPTPTGGGITGCTNAAGGFDAAVKAIQVPMIGTMNPGTSYTLQYKVQVK